MCGGVENKSINSKILADNANKNLNFATAQYRYFLFFFRSLKYLEISLKKRCDNIKESIPKIKIKNCKAFILF